jgi:hypothetical protein
LRPQQWWLRMLLLQFLQLSKPEFQISWPLGTAFLHGFIISITWGEVQCCQFQIQAHTTSELQSCSASAPSWCTACIS